MTSPAPRREEAKLGRKRDPARDEAILSATRELLLERGYDRFTMQDVAERAESGVGAIYRRWPNKEALVAEAIRTGGALAHETTDDPRADLIELVRSRAAMATVHPDFVPGVVTAMRTSEDVNQAMRLVHTSTPYRDLLERVIGEGHPQLELLAELVPAIIVHRTIFGGDLDPDGYAGQVLQLVDALGR